MNTDFDLAIIGSGFGGSLLAMAARRFGRSVVMIERGRHPRFAIGESSTPLANLLLEELARRYDLPGIAPLAKWGTWQKAHPGIACGLKRGFTFYHHATGRPWTAAPNRDNELLVAASPRDEIADTHWYRADFDHFLVRQAQAMGVEFIDETTLGGVHFPESGVELSARRDGRTFRLRARFVIDASGPRGFLHRALGLGEKSFAAFPETQALYSHFDGVRRWDELHEPAEAPPYPVDDAAVHHVFDGGWIWVLRFNNGLTSAGVAATRAAADELRLAEGEPAWRRLLEHLPSVREQFSDARAVLPFVHAPRLAFRSATVAGERWALLPSAAGFVDPLLSTGFPLTLLGVERLAALLESDWASPRLAKRLQAYETQTLTEVDTAAALVGSLYANMNRFDVFAATSKLYFAAAMFAESMRRLGRPEKVRSFLLASDPSLGPALGRCIEQARRCTTPQERQAVIRTVLQAIGPFDLAGLADPARRNWHPCLAEDLLAAAPKLNVERAAIEQLLERCGFVRPGKE